MLKLFYEKILKKKLPTYVLILVVAGWTAIIVGCGIIPTSYTTNTAQRNLAKQHTLLQIELWRRHKIMKADILEKFLKEGVKYALGLEEVICGDKSQTTAVWAKVKKEGFAKSSATKTESGGSK